jgi:hypothetical protein
MYHGDIRLGDTIDIKFTTRRFSSGAPFTLAGTPAISAYVGNGTTEITAGITLTVDFDSRTGLNNVRVVATSGNGFATATNVQLVITAGTVDSVSVVGEVVGSFSIEARSALMPTTAARTLVVDAAGLADANMVKAGPSGSGTAQTAGDIPALINTVDDFLDTEIAAIKAKTDNLPADPADASDIASSFTTVNGKLDTIDDFLDTEVAAIKAKTDNLPADPADASDIAASFSSIASTLSTIAAYIDTEVAAIKAKTDNLPASPAATGDIPTVSQIWTTALTEAYRATGATGTGAQLLYEILANIVEFSISSTTKTVKKLDGSTTAKTYTLNSATTPTSITEAT